MALEWARLLEQQQDDGRLGLTPSFLVGTLRRLPGSILGNVHGRSEVSALLELMRDERALNGKVVSIFECQNILQPVATLSTADAPGDPIESPAGGPVRLYTSPWVPSRRPVDFDWLVVTLWAHFGEAISAGHFSYSRANRRFGPFDRDDEDFIARALAQTDESQ